MDSLLLVAVLLLLVLALVLLGLRPLWSRLRRRRRSIGALEAESLAEDLLERAGYRVVERQARAWGSVLVDGRSLPFEVRADLLVERVRKHPRLPRGALLVAEIKTGTLAPDPSHPATRRQLLEYLRVFQPDGILLVDMNERRVMEIVFPPC